MLFSVVIDNAHVTRHSYKIQIGIVEMKNFLIKLLQMTLLFTFETGAREGQGLKILTGK